MTDAPTPLTERHRRRMRRRVVIAMAPAAILILYSIWWLVTAHQFAARIDGWILNEEAKGAKITPETISVGGFPISFKIRLTGVNLVWPDGFGFTGQRIRVNAYPWSLSKINLAATGGYNFALPPGSTRPALAVAGQTLRGKMRFADGALPTAFNLTGDSLSVARAGPNGLPVEGAAREMTVATVELSGSRPDDPPKDETQSGFDISVHLIDMSAEATEDNPLGGTVQDIALAAKLMGPLPATADAKGLKAWRDAGGTIDLPALSTRWGPLNLGGNGTLAFDNDMQPEGAFTARIAGYDKVLDALTKAGLIKNNAANIAKLALGLASKPGPDGQPMAEVPLTIQNHHLFLGPANLIEIPPLKLD